MRQVWKEYFPAVDALIYFIDASDTKRLAESKHELDSILRDEYLINCPILILGNKIDKHGAISHQNMENYFELEVIIFIFSSLFFSLLILKLKIFRLRTKKI